MAPCAIGRWRIRHAVPLCLARPCLCTSIARGTGALPHRGAVLQPTPPSAAAGRGGQRPVTATPLSARRYCLPLARRMQRAAAARARMVNKVRLSAQPPADRSVQPLIRRHGWTAPAHGWAARHCSGHPGEGTRARTDAAPVPPPPPPRGRTRKAPAPLRFARATASSLPVWSKNSCGFARVVFQKPPKSFATLNGTCIR